VKFAPPGWFVDLVLVAGLLAAALLIAEGVQRLNEPSPFVVSSEHPPRRTISVQVEGAVARPGLYELEHGARLGDLIAAAGGLTRVSDRTQVNEATPLQDGQLVAIPVEGEPVASSAQLLDLNTATLAELDELPEIGPVRAQAIVDSRMTDGPFARVEDLVLRGVVSLSVFEQIEHLVTVVP
jgi:competence protein ComEA